MPQNYSTEDFYQLTPDIVLDALESVGLQPQAALLALNSYENRVYQFKDHQNKKFVVKFYRPERWTDEQILEEHAFSQMILEHEINAVTPIEINAQTLFKFHTYRFAVFPSIGGRTPDLDDEKILLWLGRTLGRIHALAEVSSYQFRPQLTLDEFALGSIEFLLNNNFIPAHIEQAYKAVSQQIYHQCQQVFSRVTSINTIRLHGDCHRGNLIFCDQQIYLLDFDDSRMGPAVQDLWMLITDTTNNHQLNKILQGYEEFCEFDDRELVLIEPLRAMRMLHYSAWLARRWQDPSFQHNFPWFNENRYWEEQVLSLKEQLAEINLKCFS